MTKHSKPVETCAIYLRVSTEEQARSGYGLDAQRARCEAMATVKEWRVVETFSDEGISGTKSADDRPGLAALLMGAAAHAFDSVIVGSLDRLGRKTSLVLDLVDDLTRYGVSIVSTKESLDTTTPTGVFVLSMFAAIGQLERDTITDRCTGGRNQRGKVDGEKGGRVPMGYTRTVAGVSIDESAASTVRSIFALRADGLTLKAIAAALNTSGITTARAHGWHASSVREVLQNEADYHGGLRGESGVAWPVILA